MGLKDIFILVIIGIFIVLIGLSILKIYVINVPKIIFFIPFAIFVSFGIWLIGRFLYLTWTGVYAACSADPSCMNEDFSIVIGIILMFFAFIAFVVALIVTKPGNKIIIED